MKKFESFFLIAVSLLLLNDITGKSNFRTLGLGAINISIGNTNIVEGNSGQRSVEVAVVLSQPATGPVTVDYNTKDGSATAGSDYVRASGTISFNPGERIKKISLLVNGDVACEANESFELILNNPAGASLSNSGGTVTIVNDDCISNAGSAMYEINLTYTGFLSDPGTLDNCQIRPNGKVVLTGLVSGYEKVNADDDIIYRGNLQLDIDIDVCAIKRIAGEDKFCGMTAFSSGQVDVELEVQADARGGYIKMENKSGKFLKIVFGACDASEMNERQNMIPNNSLESVFNGYDLPELKNRTLTKGRYVMNSDDGETIVEVLRKIR